MAHYKLSLVLMLFIGNMCLLQPVIGDKGTIDKVCGWTIWPDACQQCLSGETDLDERGLANVTFSCSLTQTSIVLNDFDAIITSSGDQAVKLLCRRCEQILAEAIHNIDLGHGYFVDYNYEAAAEQMRSASDSYVACTLLVKDIPAPPVTFSDDFSLMDKYYLVSEGIMYKLPDGSPPLI